jgi:competence ComEA-like helix-hairpin-helix protein
LFLPGAARAQHPAARPSDVFQKLCGTCHKAETGIVTRRTTEQWQETIEKMISKGLKASDEDLNTVLDYLVGQFGKVNVNRAPAAEIAEVLGVSAKDAARIVKHRRDHGKFEDFEALAKVPEIDLKKLDQLREAIAF